jgi:aconitase A
LPSDPGARFDKTVHIDVSKLRPMVTFGTNPGMVIPIDGTVPDERDPAFRKALAYMQIEAGKPLLGKPVDVVFIGSCTNGRLSDIRQAAGILKGRHVAERVRLLVVPGSADVKRQAEAEGLDEIVRAAGGEWREPGCSMCIGMNGDIVPSGKLSVSTSNRNFEGRQGSGARTVLASPLTAAAAAIAGAIADPRDSGLGMEPIKQIRSRTVVLANDDIDTDQIIPARFLTTTTKEGLGKNLFADWRYQKDGRERPEFALNRPENRGAAVLVGGNNFGCGSSREHAPWALLDFGIRAVVSTGSRISFAVTR